MLRNSINTEIKKKLKAEKSWPNVTDVVCLNNVFWTWLIVYFLYSAGFTVSNGHNDTVEALQGYSKDQFFGYCFYHGQDLERVIVGVGLILAYNHTEGDVPKKIKVAQAIKIELESNGFYVDRNDATDQRVNIPKFDRMHRGK